MLPTLTSSCVNDDTYSPEQVPGWNQTAGPNSTYPAYSRVNHAKYIVTDNRLNVGTSNMAWG